ncbi:MAG: glycosyltransferase family 1 protein [bacterium]|nr:glycosyltransferase family 1 protein [bacterium]
MNIGIDLRPLMTPYRTGVGVYTYELLDALFALDYSNQYFLFYNSATGAEKYLPRWNRPNVQYVGKHWPNKLFNAATLFAGRPRLDKLCGKKLDAFYAPNFGFIALQKNIKFILTVHDLSFEFWPEFFSTQQRLWHRAVQPKRLCERADTIIVPSVNTKRDLVDCYKIAEEKIKVIYPGLSPLLTKEGSGGGRSQAPQKYNLPKNYILFLGTIEPRKNISGLVRAFELAADKLPPDYHLVIAGPLGWKTDPIIQTIRQSKLQNRIILTNYIADEDKFALYSQAQAFIYPSFYEGFGFPVLEAMAAGTSVICSDRGSLPEIVQTAGRMVNPYDAHDIATAIIETCAGDNNIQIKNGRELAAKFSWQTAAKELLKTIISP